MIRFDHDIDRLDAVQKGRVTLFVPSGSAGNAERWNPMEPQGMTIALTLDQNHHSGLLDICEAVEAIEAWFGSRLPAEAIALKRDAKPDGEFFAACPQIGNAQRRLAVISHLGHAEGFEEFKWEPLCSRIFFESQS